MLCAVLRFLERLAFPAEHVRAEPVKANITYYGDQGVRPHRARKR